MMKKKQIDLFFVGELAFPATDEFLSGEEKRIVQNGGIITHDNVLGYHQKYYRYFLTLFYQTNQNKYLCLHNSKEYSVHKSAFIKEMIPLRKLFPVLFYDIKPYLTFDEAISMFYKMFCTNHSFHYDDITVDTNRFYFGNLNLCTSIKKNDIGDEKEMFLNTTHSYLTIMGNGQFQGGFFVDSERYSYYYEVFRCLFFQLRSLELYNLNNYHSYLVSSLKDELYHDFSPGESFCDSFHSFRDELNTHQVPFNYKKANFNRALILQKKVQSRDRHI